MGSKARQAYRPGVTRRHVRFGKRFGSFDLSAFVDDVNDRAPALELASSTYYDPQDWQNISLRPRTCGLTLMYRR